MGDVESFLCAAAWMKCGAFIIADVLGNDGVHQQTNSSSLGSAPCSGNRTQQRHLQLGVHFPLVKLLITCEQKRLGLDFTSGSIFYSYCLLGNPNNFDILRNLALYTEDVADER